MKHRHRDLMIAYANDTTIKLQVYGPMFKEWRDVPVDHTPSWNPDLDYRERPVHVHQALMDIAKADPTIEWQYKSKFDGEWYDCYKDDSPSWIIGKEYRQKPAETVMVDMYQWAIRYDADCPIFGSDEYAETDEQVRAIWPNYEIVCRIEGSKISVEVSQ